MAEPIASAVSVPFTRIESKPSPLSLQILQKEVNASLLAITSPRGNGRLGLLALAVSEATFLAKSNNIPFVHPVHPGARPGDWVER